jgi:hypothetical protein
MSQARTVASGTDPKTAYIDAHFAVFQKTQRR